MPDTLGADGGIANDWKRGMMFDKRLFSLADGVGRLIAAKVACQWLGLVANIAFVVAVVRMLQPLFAPVPSATAPCIAIILIAAVVRFVTIRAAARFGSEAAERVKLALREKLFNKMLALGPSYAQRVRTAGVVQSAGEGIEQIQSFFELFLPQLCYAVLAPITLFAVLAPIDLPTAATLLACAPLIVLIVGMVAMRAARVFKKYWGKYTDMGASFLDNLQGLETLKTFDADERAARVMDEKAEQFRVMTMNVLQIQLRSLTAMDAVAYGGAAAGIGVAVWRFVSGSLSPSGVFRAVRRAAAWFDADRRGIADDSASRRFLHSAATARLVFPRCDERHDVHETYFRAARRARTGAWQQGTAGIRGFRAWCRRGVSWCFVPVCGRGCGCWGCCWCGA